MRQTSSRGFLKKENKLWLSTFTFLFIADVLSLSDSKFGNYNEPTNPFKVEIKDTTDIVRSALYLDLHIKIDIEEK